jgi:hypothetical protein
MFRFFFGQAAVSQASSHGLDHATHQDMISRVDTMEKEVADLKKHLSSDSQSPGVFHKASEETPLIPKQVEQGCCTIQ